MLPFSYKYIKTVIMQIIMIELYIYIYDLFLTFIYFATITEW